MASPVCHHAHHLPCEEVEHLLGTNRSQGLSHFEVGHRQREYGPNSVTAKKRQSPILRFLQQFNQPLVYILVAAAVTTAFLQEWVDAGVIFGVIVINAVIGFLQESRAEEAIESLKRMVTTVAAVVREGKRLQISSVDLVPGDIVLLQSGDKVPADLRLFTVRDLHVDESSLTGESAPVDKSETLLTENTVLADRSNMAYGGSLVTYGQGAGIVIAIGNDTETGRISGLISSAVDLQTPLTRKIAQFSKMLLIAILGLAGMTFIVGIMRGERLFDMFMASVALAVGAIPEGLPAAVTITLAIGVRTMAGRRAIIRRLPAVETLGSTTVICSDKTGTLTQNQMTVTQLYAGGELLALSGTGYEPEGAVLGHSGNAIKIKSSSPAGQCFIAGMVCNDSQLINKENKWSIQGDPTEGALYVSGRKAGFDEHELAESLRRIDSIPFESERQYMATLHEQAESAGPVVYVKGALEKVLDKCSDQLGARGNPEPFNRQAAIDQADGMAGRGLRVLAFARGTLPSGHTNFSGMGVPDNLVFLGLQAMIDPPRPEAEAAVNACARAGIQVKMITGDHAKTADAIARKLNLRQTYGAGEDLIPVITGNQLSDISDEALTQTIERTLVFARVAPEQKLRLVEALQERRQVVAMTGDGVNDAPALKQADIGIAMGVTGTEVAKEAADMLLTDDNFATIEAAVEEGRGVFDNLIKFITWTLPTNMGEGLVILAAVFAGVALPILPLQILWINMTTAVLLGLMLAFEPKEEGLMDRPPRKPEAPILTRTLLVRIMLVSMVLLAGAFLLYELALRQGSAIAVARTIAVNVFVMIELCYLFQCRSLSRSAFKINFFSNPWVLGGSAVMIFLQLAFTYFPFMNRIFHSAPISPFHWLGIAGACCIAVTVVAADKKRSGRQMGSLPVTLI